MKTKLLPLLSILILVSLLTAGCGGLPGAGGQPTPTPIPIVISDTDVVAEGYIVPKEDAQLAFFSSGQVEEVMAAKGDQVTNGQVVARLGNREQIEAAIAAAEAELIAAKQARQKLEDNLALAQSDAAAAMSDANKALKDAQYTIDNFTVPQNMKGMTPLEAIAAMKVVLDTARDKFEPVKYWDSGNDTREELKEDLQFSPERLQHRRKMAAARNQAARSRNQPGRDDE